MELGKSTKIVKDLLTGKEVVINVVLDELVHKFGSSIIAVEHVKKGLLFCAANSGKDTYERKFRINALMIGPPGLDKSALLRGATKLVSNSRFLSSQNSSTTSQVGIVDKEDDRYMLRLGPIPRAAGRICAIDEMGRMRPEDQVKLLHALHSLPKLHPNGDPILPPYVHRLSAHSVWFKCEYCRYQDDKWGMAKHSHPEESTPKKRGNR